jgi:hypothetical protein
MAVNGMLGKTLAKQRKPRLPIENRCKTNGNSIPLIGQLSKRALRHPGG